MASRKGKALTIKQVQMKIQEQELSVAVIDTGVEYVEFEVELKKGASHLQTGFILDSGVEIGAFCAEVEKL